MTLNQGEFMRRFAVLAVLAAGCGNPVPSIDRPPRKEGAAPTKIEAGRAGVPPGKEDGPKIGADVLIFDQDEPNVRLYERDDENSDFDVIDSGVKGRYL